MFRAIMGPSLAVGAIILSALSLERIMRLLQVVAQYGAPAYEALILIIFLVPHYLGLALPAGFFLGVMLGFRKLNDRSELIIMRSIGIPMRRLLLPLGAAAALLTLGIFVLTAWIQPYAHHQFRERLNAVATRDIMGGLLPGIFARVGPDHIIRVQAISAPGREFERVFIARTNSEGFRDFLTAAAARVTRNQSGEGDPLVELLLKDGVFIGEKKGVDGDKVIGTQFAFSEMMLAISSDNVVESTGPRGEQEREWTTPELLRMRSHSPPAGISQAHLRAEWHGRAVQVLALPVLGLLAFPLALIGQGRSARASGIALGVVILLLFEKTARFGKVMVESDRAGPWLGLWLPWFVLLVLALVCFHFFSTDARSRKPGTGAPGRPNPALPPEPARRN